MANHISNGSVNNVASNNVYMNDTPYVADGTITDVVNGSVISVANGNGNHVGNAARSISDRLARVANSTDRARHFYLFFERYRFILLNGQRDDRRHITRDRVLLQQLRTFLMEIEGFPDSVLMSRSLALLRALIAVVEQRIRAYARNVADASRMSSLVMDYLADVMHM
ncbi:hypothetical protein CTI12_AA013940 [Artemisia annua]|uniref:Uncharacterized protein n=1 Tax=Artemisia annua TaxID=35608 RepID=A0A2U1QHM7_ARTAN|nr:hypothetical protein CTI12_AA013940 [Artemisia annua]